MIHSLLLIYELERIERCVYRLTRLNRLIRDVYARVRAHARGGQNLRERDIEAKLVRMVQERGGLCYKWVSPGNPGVPDRIVITPTGGTIFVELKTEIGRLSAWQMRQRSELEKRGAEVRVLYGLEQVTAFVEEVMPSEI